MKSKAVHIPLLLAVLAIAGFIYSAALPFPVIWDDKEVVRDNHYLREEGSWLVFFTPDFWTKMMPISRADYRPLQMAALKTITLVSGRSPIIFRLANIFIHLGVTCLVWMLGRRLFPEGPAALAGAVLFALHPIHVEAVVNLRNIAELASSGLMMTALLFFIAGPRGGRILLAIAAFIGALLFKESALLFPLLLTSYLLFLSAPRKRNRELLNTIPFWFIAGLFGGWKLLLGSAGEKISPTIIQLITASSKMILSYLGMLFFPVSLRVLYPFGNASHWSGPEWYFKVIVLVSLVIFTVRFLRRKNRTVIWLLAALGLTILPLLSKIGQIGRLLAEQRLYFPSVFFCLLGAYWWSLAGKADRKKTYFSTAVLTVIVISFGAITSRYLSVWRNPVELWSMVKTRSPRAALAYNNLAIVHYRQGDKEKAREEWEEAVRIQPGHKEAHNNLGVLHRTAGRWEEAIRHFKKSLKTTPTYSAAALNLAEVYLRKRNTEKAEELVREVISRNAYNSRAYNGLGIVLEQKGDYRGARRAYLKSARLNPEAGVALRNLVDSLREEGKFREAVRIGRKAIGREPGNPAGYMVLARVYVSRGEFSEARKLLETAARLAPDSWKIKARLLALPPKEE